VRDEIVGELEMLDVGKARPSELGRPVPDQGIVSVSADIQQRKGQDALVRRPATLEVRGSVDPVVVRAGEGEVWVKDLLDGRTVVRFIRLVVAPYQIQPVAGA
jgi:hypothetical protein